MPRPRAPSALVAASLAIACHQPYADRSDASTTAATGDTTGDDTAVNGTSTAGGGSDSSSTGAESPEVTADFTTYASQPMVVDVEVRLPSPGVITLEHAQDEGVQVAPREGGNDFRRRFRIRGLAPATTHHLDFAFMPDDGTMLEGQLEFQTLPALPDFVGAYLLETTDVEPAPVYRLFDVSRYPIGGRAGATMVDPAGITRWYLTGPTDFIGPPSVWVALHLRPDGSVLYVQEDTLWIRDELGEVLLEIPATDLGQPTLHHEVLELPNGNFMALSQDFREIEYADLGTVWVVGDMIVEFTPQAEVVWTWNAFDHLDPQRRRAYFDDEIVDPVSGVSAKDWTHANAIVHDPEADTLLVSMRHQDWLVLIDHATGDVLWRLGDEGDFALPGDDRWFFSQHAPEWMPDGTLLLYDNGNGNPDIPLAEVHSRAVRFALDVDALTAEVAWQDDEPPFQVLFAGDADHLGDGRLLVTDSASFGELGVVTGRIREVDPARSPSRTWSITTPPGRWAYRTSAYDRLVGVAAR
jgi:hypothetical protein